MHKTNSRDNFVTEYKYFKITRIEENSAVYHLKKITLTQAEK